MLNMEIYQPKMRVGELAFFFIAADSFIIFAGSTDVGETLIGNGLSGELLII
jgi:hypothetical protein